MDDEKYFITTEKGADGTPESFSMIEDESGDVYWGFGHNRDADEFTAEINRWWIRNGTVTDSDDLIQVGTPVERLWVRWNDENHERFTIVEPEHPDYWDDEVHTFPVMRVMV